MIKAYNEIWVDNLSKQGVVSRWQKQGKLSQEESRLAFSLFPAPVYQPNFFVKLGLFMFSIVAISGTWGFLYIFMLEPSTTSNAAFGLACLIYAVLLLFLLEVAIRKNNYYRSGPDNALLYAALSFVFVAIVIVTDFNLPNWIYCFLTILLFIPALIRYGDPIVGIGVFVNLIAVWYIWMTNIEFGKTILPFVMMAVSALVYYAINYWKASAKTLYYADAQEVILTLTLTTFYLGGNYAVVREGNAILHDLQTSVQINLAFLFYFFTVAIPVVYVVFGLQRHDRKLFVVGLVSAGISVLTFLHYFSTIPGEWESTIGGILLVFLVIAAIKFLKEPKNNITSETDDNENLSNLEALVVSQIAQSSNQNHEGLDFGGGDFGGGGAESKY